MKTITHQPEEPDDEMDDFCREVVKMARASEQEINAALNAPFLYPRIRAQINAEREARSSDFVGARAPGGRKTGRWNWGWQWGWALAGAALLLLALVGWRSLHSSPSASLVAHGQAAPTTVATPSPASSPVTEAPEIPVPVAKNKVVAAKSLPSVKTRRVARLLPEENTEIATEYLPLTYVANSEEQSGQVVRVEMPRSAMLALGLPIDTEPTSELVKADVLVGDDGLALAIRFVHTATKRPE